MQQAHVWKYISDFEEQGYQGYSDLTYRDFGCGDFVPRIVREAHM